MGMGGRADGRDAGHPGRRGRDALENDAIQLSFPGIQVQRGDADAADAADSPDCSLCVEPSSTGTKKELLWDAHEKFSAPGAIGGLRCISGIRVPPLNLDARAGSAASHDSRSTMRHHYLHPGSKDIRMQRMPRIIPAALNLPLQKQKKMLWGCARRVSLRQE